MLDTLRTQSFRYAVALALAYGLTAALYILVSSRMAADISHDVEEMKRIETVKGIVYVAVTAVLVWAGAWWAMRRMARDAEELRRRERALVTAEGRVFAGLMASSVAHDANNVLLTVLTEAEELAGNVLPEQREGAQRLSRAVERLIQLNRRLMSASHQGLARDRQPVDLLLARPIHERTIARAGSRGCRWTSVVFDRTGLFEVESSAQRLASTRQSGVREGFGQGSASRGRVRQVVCGRRGRVSRLRRPQRARLFATLRPTRTSRAARSRSDARSTSLSPRP